MLYVISIGLGAFTASIPQRIYWPSSRETQSFPTRPIREKELRKTRLPGQVNRKRMNEGEKEGAKEEVKFSPIPTTKTKQGAESKIFLVVVTSVTC